jgi:extracellular elastinolytic metalloproteinase
MHGVTMRSRLIAALVLTALPASAGAVANTSRVGPADGNFDVRSLRAVPPDHAAAVAGLQARLGPDAIVSVDDRNGALREVARLNGFLTGPSSADPARTAIGFVRANRLAFGLTSADVDALVLVKRVRSGDGLQRLFWQQRAGGVPALDSGLRANFTADGSLINLAGSPVSGIQELVTTPRLNGAQARAAAFSGVGARVRPALARARHDARATTTFAGGDRAALGILAGATNRLVWDTIIRPDATHAYRVAVDARSGRTLLRRNLTANAQATVHRNYPGAPGPGGTEAITPLRVPQWIAGTAQTLSGPNAHVFADLNDNDLPDVGDEIGPSGANADFSYAFTPFGLTILPNAPAGACTTFPCSWDPHTGASSNATRLQNQGHSGAQAFFFVNTFHDWLAQAPISFTAANGAFEGADPVITKVLDGANLVDPDLHVAPDQDHIDNADMFTLPDGTSPTMRMFLWHQTGAPWTGAKGDPFLPANGADEADIVYHEYTHGLSGRLVVDSLGFSTLASAQAGSMGEAWSDWYAMDYLTDAASCAPSGACVTDTPNVADVRIGDYVALGRVGINGIRYQAIDCAVGSTDNVNCHSTHTGVPPGGLTFASFGKVDGSPEVHSDGEIWAQTLWDLRTAVGAVTARRIITRAMELSPDDPSYLDMRNSILQADTAFNGGAARAAIWNVFAHRGMGYFAGTLDGADTHPVANFALPPAPTAAKGILSGTMLDRETHAPIRGGRASFAGLDSGFPGGAAAKTDALGAFTMPALPVGTYPYLVGRANGYEQTVIRPFQLAAGAQPGTRVAVRRGWALSSGGGRITALTGPDFSFIGCGPTGLIDGTLGSGWASDLINGAVSVTVKLPARINVHDVAIDPGPTCGDGPDAGVGRFAIDTSPDGKHFTVGFTGLFGVANQGRMNPIVPKAGARTGVRYVRIRILSNRGNFDPITLSRFADVSELAVHGTQVGKSKAVITGPRRIKLGRTVTFTSKSSVGLSRSPIVRRSWTRSGAKRRHTVRYKLRATRLGTIRLKLTVFDFRGHKGTVTKTIKVVR